MYSQLEKLQSLKIVINPKIVNFPELRLEDVMLTIGTLSDIVNNQHVKSIMNKSGKYVIDKYQNFVSVYYFEMTHLVFFQRKIVG